MGRYRGPGARGPGPGARGLGLGSGVRGPGAGPRGPGYALGPTTRGHLAAWAADGARQCSGEATLRKAKRDWLGAAVCVPSKETLAR